MLSKPSDWVDEIVERDTSKCTYHSLGQMLPVDIYVNGIEMWTRASMKSYLVHHLPIYGERLATQIFM